MEVTEAISNAQTALVEALGLKPCGKVTAGRTVAIQEDWFTLLGGNFWKGLITCGDKQFLRHKEATVICWQCAFTQGVVCESEEQRNEMIDSFLQSVSR